MVNVLPPAPRGPRSALLAAGVVMMIVGAVLAWSSWDALQFELAMWHAMTRATDYGPVYRAAGGVGLGALGLVLTLFGIVDLRLQQIRADLRR